MFNWLVNHSGLLVTIAGILISIGVFKSQMAELDKRLTVIETINVQQIKWQQDQSSLRLSSLEIDQKATQTTIIDMREKINIIANWVQEQKDMNNRSIPANR